MDDETHEIPNDDEDEEARLRDRLLARRAMQLKELIAAEPSDESTTQRSSSVKKSHHHHKKKKRRHGSVETEETKEAVRSGDRVPSIASAVAVAHSSDTFGEEEGLNIRPPQATSSSEYKRHRKRSRDERSPEYREKTSRYRSDNYESERARREKADEGWSQWKKNLDRPWSHGGRGAAAPPLHVSSDRGHSRSPSSKGTERRTYRSRERFTPPPQSSSRWLFSKSAASSDRQSSTRYHESGRDKSKRDIRETVEKTDSKGGRPRDEERGPKAATGSKGAVSSTLVEVVSPEATPTMDEVEDVDGKAIMKSPAPESREKKASVGGSSSNEHKRIDDSPAHDSASTSSGSVGKGKGRSSSMESGEHRSDDEGFTKKRQREDAGETETKRVKYSKFESSSSSSESESEGETRNKPMPEDVSSEDEMEPKIENQLEETVVEDAAGSTKAEEAMSPEPDYESLLPVYFPALMGCRSVEEFHSLNRIEEGTYGVVYRAREKRTDEIVALKRLKMEKEKEGFPITSLREINMLLKAGNHVNIVNVREIVVGSNMDKIYLVMDYVEHDLKSLMETMKHPFLIGEVKTLLKQLLSGVKHLHDNWILHRDLKTSNLLLSHKGVLKIADFGLAREYGDPLKPYTPIVVTLWYRAPELLLGIKKYSTPIDMWSIGCIFAETLTLKPFFTGKSEIEQLSRMFKVLGTPTEQIWPGYSELPGVKIVDSFAQVKYNSLRKYFGVTFSDNGIRLLNRLLCYDPEKRVTASEALEHDWFTEEPRPVKEEMFPTWPAKSEQSKAPRKGASSPKPPSGGKQFLQGALSDKDYLANLKRRPAAAAAPGFSLKFDAPKF